MTGLPALPEPEDDRPRPDAPITEDLVPQGLDGAVWVKLALIAAHRGRDRIVGSLSALVIGISGAAVFTGNLTGKEFAGIFGTTFVVGYFVRDRSGPSR